MSKKNLKYIPFVIIVSLIIIFISRSMSNHVLFFPFWLNALLFFISFSITFYFVKKWAIFSSEKEENKKMIFFVDGLFAIVLAFVVLSAIRLPLNIFIKQQSQKNEVVTTTCPITFYSISIKKKQKRHITFTLDNKNVRMKVKPTEMAKLKASASAQKNIQLDLRKSILGTYVVESYEIQE